MYIMRHYSLDLNVAAQAGHPVNAEVRRNAKLVATAVKLQFGEFDTPLVSHSDGKVRFSPVHHHIWLNPELDPWFSSGGFLEP